MSDSAFSSALLVTFQASLVTVNTTLASTSSAATLRTNALSAVSQLVAARSCLGVTTAETMASAVAMLTTPVGSTSLSQATMTKAASSLNSLVQKASAASSTVGNKALKAVSGLVGQNYLTARGTCSTANTPASSIERVLRNLTALTSKTLAPGEAPVSYSSSQLGK